mmetsp:Transcript_2504/g.6769  ORF Transcript_2504/g.6769 Transcript_2504/m.6769 type:complete len:267 (+) Transcript_2504:136-936(+)
MSAMLRSNQNTTGMMIEKTHKTNTFCSSPNKQCEETPNQTKLDGFTDRQKMDTMLLRNSAASVADALLSLGDSDENSKNSTYDHSKKNRKRAVSVIEDYDSCSSQSIDTETDVLYTGTAKRLRRTSREFCAIPTKLCIATPNMASQPQDAMTAIDSKLSSSGKDVRIEQNSTTLEVPGSLGCISQFFHQDFRPLSAAPRLPRSIVPECLPPIKSIQFPSYPRSSPKAPLCSTEITEHKDCFIMHSYTVLPIPVPYHMKQIQVQNGF